MRHSPQTIYQKSFVINRLYDYIQLNQLEGHHPREFNLPWACGEISDPDGQLYAAWVRIGYHVCMAPIADAGWYPVMDMGKCIGYKHISFMTQAEVDEYYKHCPILPDDFIYPQENLGK